MPVARPARALRLVEDRFEPLLPRAAGGGMDRVLAELQRRADAKGRLDWSLHFVDSTIVRAHQHAAGAPRKKKRSGRPGRRLARRSAAAAAG